MFGENIQNYKLKHTKLTRLIILLDIYIKIEPLN